MFEKHILNHIKKKKEDKNIVLAKSYSSSKKEKKNNNIYGESKLNEKKIIKKYHQRNILFNNKISNNNPNSTSTSSLSSSAEKKYLTPTKTNKDNSNGNDYYFESFTNKQDLFNNVNISMPKIDYNNKYKQNKNLHLTLGAGINRNNNYFSGNDYGNNKELIVNRSFKFQKNKLVLCKKVDISNNNSMINDDEKNLISKSEEKFKINKSLYNTNDNLENRKISKNVNDFNKINNRYSIFPEKKFPYKKEENEENDFNRDVNNNNLTKEKKYKNIVLRPHKIQKENQLKYNIRVNKHKPKESPDLIKKIIPKFNIKPKYSRVFKYK